MTNLVRLFVCVMAAFALPFSGASARDDRFARFAAHDPQSELHVSYEAWTILLEDIVYDVGFSNREPADRAGTRVTGTRIRLGSNSRYRYEGNRLLLHLIDDERAAAISQYREELARLPEQVALSRLNRNEQLAYWLNLHNVIVVDELIRSYPVTRLNRAGNAFHNDPVVTVDGVELSLNDIRFGIVQVNWPDPRIIYGFSSGAVGGPTLNDSAFDGRRIWTQLDRSAREYVNALRGVENDTTTLKVSELYFEHRALFEPWPSALRNHLYSFANGDVYAVLDGAVGEPEALTYDWYVADLTNGSRCGGAGRGSLLISTSGEGNVKFNGGCGAVPPQARELLRAVTLRRLEMLREGRIGQVFVRDIETPSDSGEPEAQGGEDGSR